MPRDVAALYNEQMTALDRALLAREKEIAEGPQNPLFEDVVLVAGPGSNLMGRKIAACLGVSLGHYKVYDFSDGERKVEFTDNVRNKHVIVINSTHYPQHQHLNDLELMLDALKRASTKEISLVMPYFGYARQDRKETERVPITAAAIMRRIERNEKVARIITLEPHNPAMSGFFDRAVDFVFGSSVMLPVIERVLGSEIKNTKIVAPDLGAGKRAGIVKTQLDLSGLAFLYKEHHRSGTIDVQELFGDIKHLTALMLDDMIDSGVTLCEGGIKVGNSGAREIHAGAIHPVLSGQAFYRMLNSPFKNLFITDSVPVAAPVNLDPALLNGGTRTIEISVAPLFAEAITNLLVAGGSISKLRVQFLPLEKLILPYVCRGDLAGILGMT
jgi:ribose-phosphate pyrophosphokinase